MSSTPKTRLRAKEDQSKPENIVSGPKTRNGRSYLVEDEEKIPKTKVQESQSKESVKEIDSKNEEIKEAVVPNGQKQRNISELPNLQELNNALGDSSDDEDDFEMSVELKKRLQPEHQEQQVQQHLVLRKRDVKGNYKAKFNLEKLIIEHEKKQIQLSELNEKKQDIQDHLNSLRSEIGKKVQINEQAEIKGSQHKAHWDFLVKEMIWMAEDFEREHKKKAADTKKNVRACKKQLQEKKLKKEKELKDMKVELRRKAKNMSNMVQLFWKSVEKVVKHNYNVLYEKKRQQVRAKKLESFVSKHLKLSVKVAEELNTKAFVEQSMHQKDGTLEDAQQKTIVKLYSSQDGFAEPKVEDIPTEENKQQNTLGNGQNKKEISVYLQKDQEGFYTVDEQYQNTLIEYSQIMSQQVDENGISRTAIAEQAMEMAQSFQPTGFTLSSVNVKTKVPFLLNGSLREYQIIGLDWLVTLHNKKLNGILADEMGLGKTIQTISMLASLACDKGVWGPHLIVVPTTIIMNWEMEFKKWCPAFKILTYFGSQKERKMKRHGWSKENSFHVCITSYKLVIQDHFAFRRKKWYYMVLDEAQNIKNFKSQRWQTLLRFNTKRRLLLTGTPLQNDVMELWSLMHFLMPTIFSSQQDFKEWFSNPFSQSINHNQSLNISVVQKLQSILRPFLLRRMKRDVEKQLPEKVEHIVQCNLSRRQRLLYDEYINSERTKQTLQDTDFFSIMNVLMQLRKVCNHPDLFEPRTIESPFIQQEKITYNLPSLIYKALQNNPLKNINYKSLNFILQEFETISKDQYQRTQELFPQRPLIQVINENKNHIDNLSNRLMVTRPMADGFAQGRNQPINCNVFARSNTKSLQQTMPSVLPYESNIFHATPSYLNSACLPFSQQYYSLEDYNEIRYSTRTKEFNEFEVYKSAVTDIEQKRHLIKFAQKLVQWRDADSTNRSNLVLREPVYGENCRKAIKIDLLFSDVFDAKRHKNLDKNTKDSKWTMKEMKSAPSAVFNQFASSIVSKKKTQFIQNSVDNWTNQTEEQIEQSNTFNSFIKEVPKSQQLKRKKKQQQQQFLQQQQQALKQQQLLEEQQQLLIQKQQQQESEQKQLILQQQQLALAKSQSPKYETVQKIVQYQEKEIIVIINKSILSLEQSKQDDEEMVDEEEVKKDEANSQQDDSATNPNVEVVIREVTKEKIELVRVEVKEAIAEIDIKISSQEDKQPLIQVQSQHGSQQASQINSQQQQHDDDSAPYQRVYQNTSKRYKRDIHDQNNTDGVNTENDQKADTEMFDEDQGQKTQSQEEGVAQEKPDSQNTIKSIHQEQIDTSSNINKDISINENTKQLSPLSKIAAMIDNQAKNDSDDEDEQIDRLDDKFQDNESIMPSITYKNCEVLREFLITPLQRASNMDDMIKHFKFTTPKVVSQTVDFVPSTLITQHQKDKAYENFAYQKLMSHRNVNQSLKHSNILFFPHKNLIQYDCGKLQKLAMLLKHLHSKDSKVLIFTQMTRILDILEQFLNLHGYTYVRLDGSVKVEMRQRLVDRFNLNKKIFCFISSTRCGGIGINLTGADCVIFFDTDWNPAMDKQAQDRCHRIGQTKTVHIYRLISVNTIEENIFRKSLQKREIGGLIIEGTFDMDLFKKVSLKDILQDENLLKPKKRDIMKEENIVFHSGAGLEDELHDSNNMAMDYEKQKEIELYKRRFEEALVKIEDQEDVIALQNAKREIDDEFDEDALQGGDQSTVGAKSNDQNTDNMSEHQEDGKTDDANMSMAQEKDAKSAQELYRDMKKNEFINWRTHPTLNEVTRLCIGQFEESYDFDNYLDDRSKKDTKFVNPLNDDDEEETKQGKDSKKNKGGSDSEFEFSEEDEEMSQNGDENQWDRKTAEQCYLQTKQEIESRYFVV